MTDQSQFRTPQEIEASFLEDAYPGADFWEVETSFEVKVRVIPVTPPHETANFAAVTVTGLLTAGAAALSQEPFDQQGVAPDVSASLG